MIEIDICTILFVILNFLHVLLMPWQQPLQTQHRTPPLGWDSASDTIAPRHFFGTPNPFDAALPHLPWLEGHVAACNGDVPSFVRAH